LHRSANHQPNKQQCCGWDQSGWNQGVCKSFQTSATVLGFDPDTSWTGPEHYRRTCIQSECHLQVIAQLEQCFFVTFRMTPTLNYEISYNYGIYILYFWTFISVWEILVLNKPNYLLFFISFYLQLQSFVTRFASTCWKTLIVLCQSA